MHTKIKNIQRVEQRKVWPTKTLNTVEEDEGVGRECKCKDEKQIHYPTSKSYGERESTSVE